MSNPSEEYVVERPWGSYRVLSNLGIWWVKLIRVKLGQRLSYQSHKDRTEHWTIIKGVGRVWLSKNDNRISKTIVVPGDIIKVKLNQKHRIENISKDEDLIFCEVALGECNEEDIIRFEDDYGRTK